MSIVEHVGDTKQQLKFTSVHAPVTFACDVSLQVDLAMPSMAVAISPYTQPTTVSNQNMTYIQWLSTEPDWRVSHKNVKNMFGGGPECGEPMIIARLFYGTGKVRRCIVPLVRDPSDV